MLKYSIFLATTFIVSAAALASISPSQQKVSNPNNVTVIYKTANVEVADPEAILYCGLEDCIDELDS